MTSIARELDRRAAPSGRSSTWPCKTVSPAELAADGVTLNDPQAAIPATAISAATASSKASAALGGAASRYLLVKASSGDLVQKTARERMGFYLIVLRGHFVCHSCTGPAGAKPLRGTIATDVWSPTTGGTDFSLSDRLPAAISRLRGPTVVTLSQGNDSGGTRSMLRRQTTNVSETTSSTTDSGALRLTYARTALWCSA